MRRRKQENWEPFADELIQARLNPNYSDEATALEEFHRLLNEGYTRREIICLSLLNMSGISPEYTDESQQLFSMIANLSDKIDEQSEQIIDIILSMKRADPEGFRRLADSEDDYESAEIAGNIMLQRKPTLRERIENG